MVDSSVEMPADKDVRMRVNILLPEHPLAAGLDIGTHEVTREATMFGWGRALPTADKVAVTASDDTKALIFAYEMDAKLDRSKAAGRRVGFFARHETIPLLNDDGWKLLEAAVQWASRR
jgi:trehalose utilization protein